MKNAICLVMLALAARAQVASGTLSGTVTDPSGAAIASQRVTATQEATGLTRTALTDVHGVYVFDALPVGAYTVRALRPGFANYAAAGLTVELNRKARHNIELKLGTATAGDSVSATVSPLDT